AHAATAASHTPIIAATSHSPCHRSPPRRGTSTTSSSSTSTGTAERPSRRRAAISTRRRCARRAACSNVAIGFWLLIRRFLMGAGVGGRAGSRQVAHLVEDQFRPAPYLGVLALPRRLAKRQRGERADLNQRRGCLLACI